jgi:uncharacterized membrane protein
MIYLIFAFLTAFFQSMKDLFSKLGLGYLNEYLVAWAVMAFALPFLLPLLFFIEIPELTGMFYIALLTGGVLNSISIWLYMRAIKLSDLSITIPMLTFTPVFLLATSPIILGEFPTPLGVAGVLLVVAGSYILNISKLREGFWAPIKALADQPGPRLMFLVSFIWSITSAIDKVGVQNSSPVFWSISIIGFIAVALLPFMMWKTDQTFSRIKTQYKPLVLIGLFNALVHLTQMIAISVVLVAYVISIKRFSAVLSVIWGYLFLGEKGIRERLAGVIIMVAGVIIITLS